MRDFSKSKISPSTRLKMRDFSGSSDCCARLKMRDFSSSIGAVSVSVPSESEPFSSGTVAAR